MRTTVINTEKETVEIDLTKSIKLVPCGNGDYTIIVEGEGGDKVYFCVNRPEAAKLAECIFDSRR